MTVLFFWLCIGFLMEPQPQLQPVNPRPQIDYAEPTRRPLDLKPGPRPLDLRPRPTARQPLDIRYGPASPAEAARSRANPLGNPLGVAKPIVNNPLGFAPGKGLAEIAGTLADRAANPETFGVPGEVFEPSDIPDLPLPGEFPSSFPSDAVEPGAVVVPEIPPLARGGQMAGVNYIVTGTTTWTSANCNGSSPTGGTTTPTGTSVYGPISIIEVPFPKTKCSVEGAATRPVTKRWDAQAFNSLGQPIVRTVTGVSNSLNGLISAFPSIQIARVGGGEDTGGDAPNQQDGERRTNSARGRQPADTPLPTPRAGTTPAPVPNVGFVPTPRPLPPGFVPYAPPAPTDVPEIQPVRPGAPSAPSKFPAPITAPQMPAELGGTDSSAITLRLVPPFIIPNPGTTPTEIVPEPKKIPFLIPIPPIRRNDCCADDIVREESQRIRDELERLLKGNQDECVDLCGEAQLTQSFCDDVDGEPTPATRFETFTTLATALGFLSREIADIKRIVNPCPEQTAPSVPPILLASGSMTEGSNVAYVDILPQVRQVELIITGQVPQSIRLYDTTLSGEQQGKFGAITLAYPGVTGGNAPDAFHQWAWTRRTSFFVGKPIRNDRRIRINLKAGLSWVLYDTGLRS